MGMVIALAISFLSASAAVEFEVDGLRYGTISDQSVEVRGRANESIRYIDIPETVECDGKTYSVTTIGYEAFYGCGNLKYVSIANSVTEIRERAFEDCGYIPCIVFGAGLQRIINTFYYTYLKKAIWLGNTPPNASFVEGQINYVSNENFKLRNQVIYPHLSSIFEVDGSVYVPVNPAERTCDVISCSYSDKAKNIHIDKTVENKGITMTVQKIQPYSFYGNEHIETASVTIETDIPERCFYGCSSLKGFDAGSNVKNIGTEAFYECSSLTALNLNNSGDIGDKAFYLCEKIQSLVIGNDGDIGDNAFESCSGLQSLEVRNNGTIGKNAFSSCTSLNSLTVGNGVKSIGTGALRDCKSLRNVTIDDRDYVLNLEYNDSGKGLFSDCPLDYVYIGGKIVYPTSGSKGYSPFYRNATLREVKITDKETEIYDNEFYGCSNLSKVTIGNGVTRIGKYAFSGCAALKSFEFGSSVATIGEEAFSDCTAMTYMASHNPVPPVCGNQALDDINKWECRLYVPGDAINAYKNAEQWKNFFFIDDLVNGIDSIIGDDCDLIEVFTLGGVKVYSGAGSELPQLGHGIYIVRTSTGKTHKAILN